MMLQAGRSGRLAALALMALSGACSAHGGSGLPPEDGGADTSTTDRPTTDLPSVDLPSIDVRPTDTGNPGDTGNRVDTGNLPTDTGTDLGQDRPSTGCPTALPTLCAGLCVDTSTDRANCGGCGLRCGTDQVCVARRCTSGGVCPSTCGTMAECDSCWRPGETRTGQYCCESNVCIFRSPGEACGAPPPDGGPPLDGEGPLDSSPGDIPPFSLDGFGFDL